MVAPMNTAASIGTPRSMATIRQRGQRLASQLQKTLVLCGGLVPVLLGLLPSTRAEALFSMTFVATTGLDGNDCSRAHPCRSLARAMMQSFAGGTIVCLDSGPFVTGGEIST